MKNFERPSSEEIEKMEKKAEEMMNSDERDLTSDRSNQHFELNQVKFDVKGVLLKSVRPDDVEVIEGELQGEDGVKHSIILQRWKEPGGPYLYSGMFDYRNLKSDAVPLWNKYEKIAISKKLYEGRIKGAKARREKQHLKQGKSGILWWLG